MAVPELLSTTLDHDQSSLSCENIAVTEQSYITYLIH